MAQRVRALPEDEGSIPGPNGSQQATRCPLLASTSTRHTDDALTRMQEEHPYTENNFKKRLRLVLNALAI